MIPFVRRIIWKEKSRFFITISGVGFSIMLILFFFELFEGIKKGAVSYIESTSGDIWISNKNSTNLMRTSSFLYSSLKSELKNFNEVGDISSILQVITTTHIGKKAVTLLILGIDTESNLASPQKIITGNSTIHKGEIIIDKAFAAKHNLILNDTLMFDHKKFLVCGISEGTNLLVSQFAFVTLKDAQKLLGLPGVISFFVAELKSGENVDIFKKKINEQLPNLSAYDKQEFIENNLEELRSGVLPVLGTVAVVGAIIGAAVVTLMLFSSVMDKREDYALLKAIGASHNYISLLVFKQSILSSISGFFIGLFLNFICAPFITNIVPELTLHTNWHITITIFIVSLMIGIIGSLAPLRKLAVIYPGEVFRP